MRQVRDKVDGTAQNRIAVKQPLPQVNQELAKQIMQRKEATETLALAAAVGPDGKAPPVRARDKELFTAVTDCGAGGFSSAIGEMGEEVGAEVWLERAPLKYAGLNPVEIWISEAQERMVLSVPPEHEREVLALFAAEDVEAVVVVVASADDAFLIASSASLVVRPVSSTPPPRITNRLFRRR